MFHCHSHQIDNISSARHIVISGKITWRKDVRAFTSCIIVKFCGILQTKELVFTWWSFLNR